MPVRSQTEVKELFVWCGILLFLGVLAFLDSVMNMGEIFRRVNSVFFMLVSLGLLVRTTMKIKAQKFEQYENRMFNLEQQVKILREGRKKLVDY